MNIAINTIEKYINDNMIDSLLSYAKSLSPDGYATLIGWMISRMTEYVIPDEGGKRNTVAYTLGELKCDEAVPQIITLIKRDSDTLYIGTLLYSLRNLNCVDYLNQIFHLLYIGNYEARREIFTLLEINKEKIPSAMCESMKEELHKAITNYKDILLGLYIAQDEILAAKV